MPATVSDTPPTSASSALVRRVQATPSEPLDALVVSPGGTGKTALLDGVGRAYTDAGIEVVRDVSSSPSGTSTVRPATPRPGPSGSRRRRPPAGFSERELGIGRQILAGLTYKQIGQRLFLSAKTVEHHMARRRQRSGAGSRDELFGQLRVALAEQAG